MKTSMWGMQLKAISLGNFLGSTSWPGTYLPLVCAPQLVHGVLAGAGDGLVGRHHHALDGGVVVQGLQRHHQLHGRAVGIGDDVLLGVAGHRVGVDLGHDQRHVLVVAPGRGVVDDDAALGGDLGRPFLGHADPPADIRQKSTLEKSKVARSLHLSVASPNETSTPLRPARSQRVHFPARETGARSGSTAFPGPRCPWRRRRRRCSSCAGFPSVLVNRCRFAERACNWGARCVSNIVAAIVPVSPAQPQCSGTASFQAVASVHVGFVSMPTILPLLGRSPLRCSPRGHAGRAGARARG